MNFRILYCKPCGYDEQAEQLARDLRERHGAEVEVEEGGLGQFDVFLDGELVASKGGLLKRILVHGAPAPEIVWQSIERALADRDGAACELPPGKA